MCRAGVLIAIHLPIGRFDSAGVSAEEEDGGDVVGTDGVATPTVTPRATLTATVRGALVPPTPEQLIVNILYSFDAVRLVMTCEPRVDFVAPLQARKVKREPKAMQEVEFVEDHVSVVEPPKVTLVGEAEIETVGAGAEVCGGGVCVSVVPEPEESL